MMYTVEEAEAQLGQLIQEAEEGKVVEIVRPGKAVVRLTVGEAAASKRRIPGKYAGLCQYSDDVFKSLETDEELREYGFDILADTKLISEPAP
jgi:antitoxin (DNA-binding transcriptional repressor) of toxin-antitoxin stability system